MSVAELAESTELVDLTVAVDDRIAVLTLNRPESLNAFSSAMGRSLTAALRACDADDEVHVVVITGAGRAFCAGADFSGGAGVFGTPDSSDSTKPPFSSDPPHRRCWGKPPNSPAILATHTAPLSVGVSKRLLWMSAPTPEEINTLERELHLHLMGTADSTEGVMAFMEKRDPNWTLRISQDWPEWLK